MRSTHFRHHGERFYITACGSVVARVLMMGGRAKDPGEALKAIEDAAWEARMEGGCHTRTSEILTTMARAMRLVLAPQDVEEV